MQQERLIALGISLLIGIVFVAMLSLILTSGFVADFLLDRNTELGAYPFTIQNLMWVVFFIGLGELFLRYRGASNEHRQVNTRMLPEDDSTMLRREDLAPIYKAVQQTDADRKHFLQRLIGRCVLQFQTSRSIDQTNTLFNSSMELYQHEIDLSYNMLRYIVWLIPTLGFIGTVVGIALALNFAGSGVIEYQDPELLKALTAKLGVAFNTTLLALMQSAVLMFLLHIAQGREEWVLNHVGQYCLDNLINRLYEK
jgi:biopolymer transport protein ExbB/TolQ